MEYENMRLTELKALARDRGLRNYSRMRKSELVALLQNNPPPAPQMSTWDSRGSRGLRAHGNLYMIGDQGSLSIVRMGRKCQRA